MPTKLARHMRTLADAISQHGDERWQRLLDWERYGISVSLTRQEPGEDDIDAPGTVSDRTRDERADERSTSRYAEDTRRACAVLEKLLIEPEEVKLWGPVAQVRYLLAIAELRTPRANKSRAIAAAQAANDGWCRSCIRVDVFEPIGVRPSGEPYYADLCRWCGRNRGEGAQPTLDMVRVHHRLPQVR